MIRLGNVFTLAILVISVVENQTEAVLHNYGLQSFSDKSWNKSRKLLTNNKPLNTFKHKAHGDKSNRNLKANLSDVLMMKLVSYYENKYKVEPARIGSLPLFKDRRIAHTKMRKNNHIKSSVPEVVII